MLIDLTAGCGCPRLQVGNYGGAWYRQGKDFAEFPGSILVSVVEPSCLPIHTPACLPTCLHAGTPAPLLSHPCLPALPLPACPAPACLPCPCLPACLQMTTNCITEPRSSYASRLFTTGEVGWEGVRHIPGTMGQTKDYSELIKKAQVCGVCGHGQAAELLGWVAQSVRGRHGCGGCMGAAQAGRLLLSAAQRIPAPWPP